ncbi:SDR family NAD(P)-dependent oxidoreductase [Conexibacter sp. CPCC 206217]|uniref:SDR family NAD(P)-dependent oxidoreductase n=1 Tax=Conexibacter sp. CPCC 206217 TaxID=3064574 RepID=UPI0027175481|nr:SDR family oxidoreductase [Conexibacter sp. CPCC 206217]MDO8209545.1 SDR family oxidoreductase [Conexibacter sp. CPCC 206217]
MTSPTDTTTRKIAIVTGANRGLGRSTALHLAADGVAVIATYRSNADEADAVVAQIVADGGDAVALQLDVAVVASFAQFAADVRALLQQRWQRDSFDFLVNNAGFAVMGPFEQLREADFDALVDVHFKGVVFLTQALLPLLADGGSIVNTSTGLTRFTAPDIAAYAAMKGAIEVLTRHLAQDLGARGITVNTVAPGPIGTDFGGGAMRDDEQVRSVLAGHAALGRVGEPDDVGGAIAALLSSGNRWVTGQRIEVSGGTHL